MADCDLSWPQEFIDWACENKLRDPSWVSKLFKKRTWSSKDRKRYEDYLERRVWPRQSLYERPCKLKSAISFNISCCLLFLIDSVPIHARAHRRVAGRIRKWYVEFRRKC